MVLPGGGCGTTAQHCGMHAPGKVRGPGAPLMLSTIAMCLLGASVLGFGRRGRRSTELRPERDVVGLDLGYFMIAFGLTVIAGVWHLRALHWALAGALVVVVNFVADLLYAWLDPRIQLA